MKAIPNIIRPNQRKIIHIDMDCFYAAIEIRDNPSLVGLPVAVGGSSTKRGVLCTCNYVARKFGLHSAMPTATAERLCPQLVLVPVNFAKYKAISKEIQAIFRQFTDLVEPLSLDEAYLDVSASPHEQGSATLIAERIRRQIWEELQLTSSAGVASNKFLAKIASGWNKPNGICIIRPEQIAEFVAQLPVEKLFGVGKVTARKLQQLNVRTCSDLQKFTHQELLLRFGKLGTMLYFQAQGIDNRPVVPNRPRKSLSVEQTFAINIQTPEAALAELEKIYCQFVQRFNEAQISTPIKSQFIKIKFADWQQTTREKASQSHEFSDFHQLFLSTQTNNPSFKPLRLLGLGVSFDLTEDFLAAQPELF